MQAKTKTVNDLHNEELKRKENSIKRLSKDLEKWAQVKDLSPINLDHFDGILGKLGTAEYDKKDLEKRTDVEKHNHFFIKTAEERRKAVESARKKARQAKATELEVLAKCEISFNDKAMKTLAKRKISPLQCELEGVLIVAYLERKNKKSGKLEGFKAIIGEVKDLVKQ